MRTVDFVCCGKPLTLYLSGAALFDCYDKFGTQGHLLDHIQGSTKKSFDATCWMLWKLSEQGELYRRWMGMDRREVPSEGFFRANLGPLDVLDARAAISRAVELGFRRDVPEPGGVDLGLMELEKKTAATEPLGENT